MARYLLDTNILIFLLLSESDKFCAETSDILYDNSNQLYTSSVCVMELLQLYKIKKIQAKKYSNATELFNAIEDDFFIKILSFGKEHLTELAKLKIALKHNDPFDHSIIAHAMAENLILVSSDKKFKEYTGQNLKFSFNKR